MGKLRPPPSLHGDALALWEELRPTVERSIGVSGLEALCTQVARLRDARARIDEEGLIIADARGNPVPHPAIQIERHAQAEVRSWMAKYGKA